MYKVKRSIIMAAGLGKRMQPVTLTTPKPLVPVNGVRMIDTVIRGLHANGIHEIYVVVGHLKAAVLPAGTGISRREDHRKSILRYLQQHIILICSKRTSGRCHDTGRGSDHL